MQMNNIVQNSHFFFAATNCPNCGAVVREAECEYCGTIFHSQTSEQTTSSAEADFIKDKKALYDSKQAFNEACKRHLDLIRALSNAKYGI